MRWRSRILPEDSDFNSFDELAALEREGFDDDKMQYFIISAAYHLIEYIVSFNNRRYLLSSDRYSVRYGTKAKHSSGIPLFLCFYPVASPISVVR